MNFDELANSKNWWIRWAVAENPNCPVHLLEKLAVDRRLSVIRSTIKNPNCPQYLKDYIKTKNFIAHYGNEF